MGHTRTSGKPMVTLYYFQGTGCYASMSGLSAYADRIYDICPARKLSLGKQGKIVVGMSPGAARDELFQDVKDMIKYALDEGHHIRLMGHSYGGYYVSKLMSALAKEMPDQLDRIRAVTLGTVRMHKYNPLIHITHYIFEKDPYGRLNWFVNKRADVVKIRCDDPIHKVFTWHDAYIETFKYNHVNPFDDTRGSLQMALPPHMVADRKATAAKTATTKTAATKTAATKTATTKTTASMTTATRMDSDPQAWNDAIRGPQKTR